MSDPDALLALLRAQPNLPAAAVREALQLNRTGLMRMVRAADSQVLAFGRARRTRYAARRVLPNVAQPLPIFQVDTHGHYSQLARLHLAHPHGSVLQWDEDCPWPLDAQMQDGWFEGLPYFLQDLRPEGFLGRAFARAYARLLELPLDPKLWSDEHTLVAVSRFGPDWTGNTILGGPAFESFLEELQRPRPVLPEARIARDYARLADEAMAHGYPGSSAAGEFPKFTATRHAGDDVVKVLVKFSGSDDSPGSQRWSDLLVCEHLAARTLAQTPGLAAADTRILQAAGRTFLESTRFDRHGLRGRSPVCSWAAINYTWFGLAEHSWVQGAAQLRERKLVAPHVAENVALLWHFGRLIANTDMHDGNLSFRPTRIDDRAMFDLAPAYDMLPMLYAPGRGVELPEVTFQPHLPLPAEREAWARAAFAAERLWDAAANDDRISQAFRRICRGNREQIHQAIGFCRHSP